MYLIKKSKYLLFIALSMVLLFIIFFSLQKQSTYTNKPVKESKVTGNRISLPSESVPWGIKAIYNDPELKSTSGGKGVKIAVLDTGVDKSHPDLINNIEQCKSFILDASEFINGECTDDNGHGTHVSGIIVADGGSDGNGILGVAPESKLWSYKVLDENANGYGENIASAIRHATDEAKKQRVNVVMVLSLGMETESELIQKAIEYAYKNGLLIICVTGNKGPSENTILFPGRMTETIAVAALEKKDNHLRVTDLSSRGNENALYSDTVVEEGEVELAAPGNDIESTWLGGKYKTLEGTSMAAPHIGGLSAKIWSENPELTNVQLRELLKDLAIQNDIIDGIGTTTGSDLASGFGFPIWDEKATLKRN